MSKFNAGDEVRLRTDNFNADLSPLTPLRLAKKLVVTGRNGEFVYLKLDDGQLTGGYLAQRFEKVQKFQIGDRIVLQPEAQENYIARAGTRATVTGYSATGLLRVEWDNGALGQMDGSYPEADFELAPDEIRYVVLAHTPMMTLKEAEETARKRLTGGGFYYIAKVEATAQLEVITTQVPSIKPI